MTHQKAYLRYPGAKWASGRWIASHFPVHECYVELFAGSAACYFLKAPAKHSVLNDLSGDVVNLFSVLRTHAQELAELVSLTPWSRLEYEQSQERTGDDLEDARRFLVFCWQAHGARFHSRSGWSRSGPTHTSVLPRWSQLPDRLQTVVSRLREAEIECRPALQLLADSTYRDPSVLLYVDPPYVLSTRHARYYQDEMTDDDHVQLLRVLDDHPAAIVLSGYAHPLYDALLPHWRRTTRRVTTEGGMIKQEVLWLNQRASSGYRQLSLFEEVL